MEKKNQIIDNGRRRVERGTDPELIGILLNKNISILLRSVLIAGGVKSRHEIVVEVVIAA